MDNCGGGRSAVVSCWSPRGTFPNSDGPASESFRPSIRQDLELGDLQPHELFEMSVEDRIELLKSKILHYTQDLLEFDTVEIRLIDKRTGHLEPLLTEGNAAGRRWARLSRRKPPDNGVTGFVAATGRSYLCEDTTN